MVGIEMSQSRSVIANDVHGPVRSAAGRGIQLWVGRCGLAAIMLACVPYLIRLDEIPRMVGSDETHFAGHAHSIAFTGKDLNGTSFPFFVHITDPIVPDPRSEAWYQPLLFYVLAAEFRFLPVAEWSMRLPTALMAILNIWLVYAIGCRLFQQRLYAVLAALFLALTPAHLIMSRQALDYICPLPFVLGWFLCLQTYLSTNRVRWLAVAGLLLGVGAFSYISAWFLMPLFLALTLVVLAASGRPFRAFAALVAGVSPPLLLAAAWFWEHPEMLVNTISRYQLRGAAAALGERVVPIDQSPLVFRISVFWDSFNPSFLFFGGGSGRTTSTAQVGVFLLPIAVFLAVGLYVLAKRRSTATLVMLTGFASAALPVVASLPRPVDYNIARMLVLVPFVALISACGVEYLLARPRNWVRSGTAILLLFMPLQFARFLDDYFNDYQLRAAFWLDPVNTGAVADAVIAQDAIERIPTVYWRDNLDDISIRWKFFMLKNRRADLWDRTVVISEAPKPAAPGSVVVLYAEDPLVDALLRDGNYSTLTTIHGINGQPNSTIVRRVR
jgi:4-amino-4-deoxy-L-arabinose transferase-like glycosyltransferase